jgi:hypothetical protein
LLGVLIEDSDIGIPVGLGDVVFGQGGSVLCLESISGGPDGLGDLGWEVSDLSQVIRERVVLSVVEVSDCRKTCVKDII